MVLLSAENKMINARWQQYIVFLLLAFPVIAFCTDPVSGSSTDKKLLQEKRAAALKGDNDARVWMGLSTVNSKERLHWFLLAAREGNAAAQHNLASMYDVQGDFVSSLVWWKKLASRGDLEAAVHVANAYRYGQGVSPNVLSEYTWRLVIQQFEQGNCERLREIERLVSPKNKERAQRAAKAISKRFADHTTNRGQAGVNFEAQH